MGIKPAPVWIPAKLKTIDKEIDRVNTSFPSSIYFSSMARHGIGISVPAPAELPFYVTPFIARDCSNETSRAIINDESLSPLFQSLVIEAKKIGMVR